jgi:hypothetical protein
VVLIPDLTVMDYLEKFPLNDGVIVKVIRALGSCFIFNACFCFCTHQFVAIFVTAFSLPGSSAFNTYHDLFSALIAEKAVILNLALAICT